METLITAKKKQSEPCTRVLTVEDGKRELELISQSPCHDVLLRKLLQQTEADDKGWYYGL